jgi:ABC-type bacteriocin/lantibiotic exporter with double-glycine peptidase domain
LYLTAGKGMASSWQKAAINTPCGWLEEIARLVKSFKFSHNSGLHLKKADEKTVNYVKSRTTTSVFYYFNIKLVAFKVAVIGSMMTVGVILLLNQQLNIGQFVAAEIILIIVMNAVEKDNCKP